MVKNWPCNAPCACASYLTSVALWVQSTQRCCLFERKLRSIHYIYCERYYSKDKRRACKPKCLLASSVSNALTASRSGAGDIYWQYICHSGSRHAYFPLPASPYPRHPTILQTPRSDFPRRQSLSAALRRSADPVRRPADHPGPAGRFPRLGRRGGRSVQSGGADSAGRLAQGADTAAASNGIKAPPLCARKRPPTDSSRRPNNAAQIYAAAAETAKELTSVHARLISSRAILFFSPRLHENVFWKIAETSMQVIFALSVSFSFLIHEHLCN